MSSNTGHSKEQIATHLRTLAANLTDGSTTTEQTAVSLAALAGWLDIEHKGEERQDFLANRGTVECPLCHGMRIYSDGEGRMPTLDESHVQCPKCHGWGREAAPP